jgi:prepilin-type N-terminal cleavage/methylation domain-containing protein
MKTDATLPAGAQQGFSLLEVLITMIVLGLGILMYMRFQSGSSSQTRKNAKLYRAGALIEKHIEDLRLDIAENPETSWPPLDTILADTLYKDMHLTRSVAPAISDKDDFSLPDVRQVKITVEWDPNQNLDITTYVSKKF